MTTTLPILDAMPSPEDFYARYWGRSPFVVRNAIPREAMATMIDGDELAALSCDDTARSRIVSPPSDEDTWSCRFGPFHDQDFHRLPPENWSLLVQNVEQFHPETAQLLQYFNFSPRWLLDDIMVSYAAPGGSVGPHMDSYHVFLVQGAGKRRWKVGHAPLTADEEIYVEDIDLKVLRDGFTGDDVDVSCGDVIYIPPQFAHEGVTQESSLTFSVGFLGPKLSDLFMGYGQYLAEITAQDYSYMSSELTVHDAGFEISRDVIHDIKTMMTGNVGSENFDQWVSEFFSGSSNEHVLELTERGDTLSCADLLAKLSGQGLLTKPPYIKLVVIQSTSGDYYVGVGGRTIRVEKSLSELMGALRGEQPFSLAAFENDDNALALITTLYNDQALDIVDS